MSKIKNFKFKNVRSYGNKMTEIPFDMDNGLVLILGDNGFGKTSICEAIEYGIYGKSSRVQSKNLPNWINGNMFTEVEFDTNDNRRIKLARGLSPDFYQLSIDDNSSITSKGKKSENIAGKNQIDKMVEEELFGIPFDIFANNILLSIHDFKSFINMKAADKRKIIDKIFDTDVFNQMVKTVKEEIKAKKETALVLKTNIDSKQELFDSTMQRIEELKPKLDENKEDIIRELQNKMNEAKETLSKYLEEQKSIITKKEADLKLLYSLLDEKNKHKSSILMNITNEKDKLNSDFYSYIETFKSENNKTMNAELDVIQKSFDLEVSKLTKPEDSIKELQITADNKRKEKITEYNNNVALEEKSYSDSVNSVNNEYSTKISEDKKKWSCLVDEFNNRINTMTNEIKRLSESKDKIFSDKVSASSNLESIKRSLDLYKNSKCPTCGVDLQNNEYHISEHNRLKEELTKYTELLNQIESKLNSVNEELERDNSLLYDATSELQTIKTNEVKSISSIESEQATKINELLSKKESKLNEYKSAYDSVMQKIDSILENAYSSEKNKYNDAYSLLYNKFNEDKSIISKKYSDAIEAEENSRKIKLDEDKKNIDIKYSKEYSEIESELSSISSSIDSVNKKGSEDIDAISSKINDARSLFDKYSAEYNSISNSDIESVVRELEFMATSTETELNKMNSEYSDLSSEISVMEDTGFLIGDDGLKKVIMRRILPSFNATIDKITQMFDFKYRFIFDDEFNCHMSYCGQPVPISTSRGEEKIMDIIVLLSTLQLILMKHPSVNMLFLDEIFSNLDVKNIQKAVSILKDYSMQYNLMIFVMSHTTVPVEMFDEIITVKNDGNFSEIEIKK